MKVGVPLAATVLIRTYFPAGIHPCTLPGPMFVTFSTPPVPLGDSFTVIRLVVIAALYPMMALAPPVGAVTSRLGARS